MSQPSAFHSAENDLIFVDSRVKDSAILLKDLQPGAKVVYLSAAEDGLAQLAAALVQGGQATSVHVLAHGSTGQLWLGSTFLDSASLAGHADTLAAIGRGMAPGGDLLVYACNLANGDAGAALISRLADLTGTDVAASSNASGANGDWQLEISTGRIADRALLNASALQEYALSLATLTVTTGLDSGADATIGASLAADTGDGGGLSLREALSWAAANDTITFNAGMTVLLNSTLTLNKNLTIDGDLNNDQTADVTFDGQYKAKVLNVIAGTAATLDGLVITRGLAAGNGGNGGDDALAANGAGIYNAGTLTLNNTMVSANAASGGGGGGGVTPTYAGGAGGGGGAVGGGIGGRGGDTLGSTGTAGSAGQGGAGGGFANMGGRGGNSTGGAGGSAYPGYSTGSAGGTANGGTISIGGGGGGDGYNDIGGAGGGAVGGIYNDSGATVTIIGNSVVSGNIGAGGGGGGGGAGGAYTQAGGAGGVGVGGIWNKGTLQITAANFAAMSGNVGGSGIGGTSAGAAGTSPASYTNLYNNGGVVDLSYVPPSTAPTATLVVADTALVIGETSLVTITFSEAVTGFDNSDLAVANGTLSAVSSSDGGTTWTATLTPAAAVSDASNVITLDNTGVKSGMGTPGIGTTDSNNYAIDTARPTASLVLADTALKAGETSKLTITFSEAVTNFTTADLTADNGTVSGLSSADGGITWTATLTPDAAVDDASNLVQLNNATVNDLAGNAGSGTTNSNNYAIDTARPTATVAVADNALSAGETTQVTVTFSEAVSGFTNADLTADNGSLSAVSSSDGGVTWTATLTPAAGIADTSNTIQLDNTGVSDAAGNAGSGTTSSNNYTIDTLRPTATIVVADSALAIGETTMVTITFSEAVTGFDGGDLTVANGTLGGLSTSDGGIIWSATLTPTPAVNDTSNVITLDGSGVQDAAGNTGTGTTGSNNYGIDTVRPTATVVLADTDLNAGETSQLTITFSEAVTNFTTADLTADHGTVSGLSSADGGITWTATLTPDAAVDDTSNVVQLNNATINDLAGNAGIGTSDSANYSVRTVRPTVLVALADSTLTAGETTGVTFTFSEAVSGFDVSDVVVENGTLSSLASSDGGVTWNATLTPTSGVVDASNVVTVTNSGYTNAAGNSGSGSSSSANYTVSTVRPTATVALSDSALKAGETATVTITFSEAVSGFDNSDVTVQNGKLGAVASSDGGVTWTAVLTPTADTSDASNVVSVTNAGVVNAAGNAGVGQTDSANYAVDTDVPNATVALSDSALVAGETALLTITFDQAVTGFSGASINVANGSLSGLASSDGGVTWTATLTPASPIDDASNVVSVDMSTVTDASGNAGSGLASSANYSVHTVRPSVTLAVADATLLAGVSSTVTIKFSEAVTGLDTGDFGVANGALSGLATADGGVTWTAVLTPADGVDDTSNVITLDKTGYTSLTGNTGQGSTDSNNYALATSRPSATILVSDVQLDVGQTAAVTITFSEAVSGFSNADLTVGTGTLSPVSSADGGITWTATLTPDSGVNSSGNVITLNNAGVQDASGNAGIATTMSNPYVVNTAPDSPEPGNTVDGVPVTSSATIDPATGIAGTRVTVPIVPAARNDDPSTPNSGLADIPLGIDAPAGAPQVDLTVSLPAGAGLQAEGPNILLSNAQALVNLINRIEDKTVAGSSVQQEMAGLGGAFLDALGGSVMLETKTLVPIVTPGTTLTQPIVISGSSTPAAGGNANAPAIALVIDTGSLTGNTILQLDNVDFAAVVGASTLRGGSGGNMVAGDGASQNIFLGAGDDKLFGGGGNDIIGSAGGSDLLDGGSGNDVGVGGIGDDSVSGGSGNDVLQGGRSGQGDWTFFVDSAGRLAARHETALFAPGSSELVTLAELNGNAEGLGFVDAPAQGLADIALLYGAVFGRAPDLGGLEFWSGTGLTMSAMARAFSTSTEWAAAGYNQLSDEGFINQVYQNALGRAPDAAGAAYWTGQLAGTNGAAPHSRFDVMAAIALSGEHRAAVSTSDGITVATTRQASESDWFAGSGNDRLEGGQGSDILMGGDGLDSAVFSGARAGYKFLLAATGQVLVREQSSGDMDTLSGIETGSFADGTVDLGFTQAATPLLQKLGLLYQTLFDRAGDLAGIAWWSGQYTQVDTAVRDFMASSEYAARYGSASDKQFVEALYRNTGLQDSEADGIQYWEGYLTSHTREELITNWIGHADLINAQFGDQGLWLA